MELSFFLRNLHRLRRKQQHVATFSHQHTVALLKRWFAQNCTFAPRLAFEVAQHALKKSTGKVCKTNNLHHLRVDCGKCVVISKQHTTRGIGKWRNKRNPRLHVLPKASESFAKSSTQLPQNQYAKAQSKNQNGVAVVRKRSRIWKGRKIDADNMVCQKQAKGFNRCKTLLQNHKKDKRHGNS